ncbi:hypothetical protein, partial [Duncaniella muris]|uniref:hypothetical protein n=1 Tax=Duncaniella muris TaxID=2094150 RepID=UPI0026758990
IQLSNPERLSGNTRLSFIITIQFISGIETSIAVTANINSFMEGADSIFRKFAGNEEINTAVIKDGRMNMIQSWMTVASLRAFVVGPL